MKGHAYLFIGTGFQSAGPVTVTLYISSSWKNKIRLHMAQANNLYYLWIWVSKFEDFALLIQSSPLAKLLLKAARPLYCVPTVLALRSQAFTYRGKGRGKGFLLLH